MITLTPDRSQRIETCKHCGSYYFEIRTMMHPAYDSEKHLVCSGCGFQLGKIEVTFGVSDNFMK